MYAQLSIPDKLNIVLKKLSLHDRLRFMETLEQHPEFLADVLKNIELKSGDVNNSAATAFEFEALNQLIKSTGQEDHS